MGREGRLAQEFPTGLNKTETGSQQLRVIDGFKGRPLDPLEELSFGKPIRQHVREFGAVMALVACFIAYAQEHKNHVGLSTDVAIIGAGLLIYCLGVFAPAILKPAWQAWMKFAHYLGLVMTTVILVTMWTLIVIPIGLAVKLLGVKIMDMRFRAPVTTYWEDRSDEINDFKLLERQW